MTLKEIAHKTCYNQLTERNGAKLILLDELKTAFINGYTRGQKQTETKCCALCKYWNYDGIQKYCFFERENLRKKERFDTCKNFKDARKENE